MGVFVGKMREFSNKNVDVTTDVDCTDKILDFTSKIGLLPTKRMIVQVRIWNLPTKMMVSRAYNEDCPTLDKDG